MTPPSLMLTFTGEMDFCDVATLALSDTLDLTAVRRITMDLSHLDFVDASGAETLRRFIERHRAAGRDVVITGAGDQVRRIFALLGEGGFLTPV